MYSKEERLKAVELLIQYDMMYSVVIRELGYPNINTLREWYREYIQDGDVHEFYNRKFKYTNADKQYAVNYYLEHGKCIRRTCKKLGYPSRTLLKAWIEELAPAQKKYCTSGGKNVEYTQEQKQSAVIDMCSRMSSVAQVAEKHGVTRPTLYKWKKELLKESSIIPMKKKEYTTSNELMQENEKLIKERDELRKEVYRLQLEKDILEKAAEIIKKEQGIILDSLTNREKAIVIDALRDRYTLKELLMVFHMAKSSYCYQMTVLKAPDKYEETRENIRNIFSSSRCTYGYRRIHQDLKNAGKTISEKVVRRLMKEENLLVVSVKRKKYSSYLGEISPAVPNVIDRDFHADEPNLKWLTDITEFHIPAGKIYLSPIIDCFDGLPVSWTIGTSPDADLVNSMLDAAISTLKAGEHPLVHSDRGCHYRWPGWIERMENAGLTRSMSKKGCSPDNSACEGFFGRLKNEMFYNRKWDGVSIDEFIRILDTYIHWYAESRIKMSLGGLSPLQYRKTLGYVD
ncbi:MAG: IS3 family transposase [Lachnospiraceae bacterium]|nr:IS3 family transposase [Lachnospiraceae bacterium]